MYIEIQNDKLLSWCEKPYMDYSFVDIDYSTFDPEKYEVQNGDLVDISQTESYLSKIAEREKSQTIAALRKQIDEIDTKRIRAIAEPQLKDEATGQTWLEFYTEQITDLRNKISNI